MRPTRLRPLPRLHGWLRGHAARFLRAREGMTAVEFAIAVPAFLLLVLSVIEGGRALWALNTVQYATEQTGRYAMLNPTATDTQLRDRAKSRATGLDPDSITVTIATETVKDVQYKRVDTSYSFQPAVGPFLSFGPFALSATARVPLTD